jgi:type III protein arginine methyltransferase
MSDILDRYPQLRADPLAMATMCALLRDKGLHDDALALAHAAMNAAPDSTGIRSDVAATLLIGVPMFHVPMLLDHARNQAYATAIKRMVRPGMLVLEIGSGAGLLAMLCARAGARVVTCEEHPMIAAAAEQIIERNGLADRITLIRKRSTLLTVPEDLPAPADLVIHEIFGSNLVCEGVTAALTDARERLLAPGALSLPPRARVRCALVTDHTEPADLRLDDVEGFDLSAFEVFSRPTIALRKQKSQRLQPLTDPASGMCMDYDSPPPFGPTSEKLIVKSRGGRIDGIVQWIALDFGNGEVLENDPFVEGPESSWGVPYTPLIKPIETIPGEMLEIRLRRRGTLLTADVSRLETA